MLEELGKLHNCGLIHGGSYFPTPTFRSNIVGPTRNEKDFKLAKLPPCTIEQKVTMYGVEYPIVRSHPVPNDIEWNAPWDVTNSCLIILIIQESSSLSKHV
jgi:hypothetical protein